MKLILDHRGSGVKRCTTGLPEQGWTSYLSSLTTEIHTGIMWPEWFKPGSDAEVIWCFPQFNKEQGWDNILNWIIGICKQYFNWNILDLIFGSSMIQTLAWCWTRNIHFTARRWGGYGRVERERERESVFYLNVAIHHEVTLRWHLIPGDW